MNLDLPSIRSQFPLLERVGPKGRPIIYLDSAATALKPKSVIDAVAYVLTNCTANVHRSVHLLGDEATQLYENARQRVANLINAESHEIVFVRNTTEALNLLARCWPRRGRVVTTLAEHHSNLLPWTSQVVRLSPKAQGELDLQALDLELSRGTVALVSLSHVSNVTGLAIDAASIAERVHKAGAIFVLDGAQSVPHLPVDVQAIDCDFLAFSGHKLGAPTGIGVLYGKAERLAEIDWYLHGGSTVEAVHLGTPIPKPPPWRFEAGTPAIEAAVGLATAADFIDSIGLDVIAQHERSLIQQALARIEEQLPEAEVVGPRDSRRVGPLSIAFRRLPPNIIARGLSDGFGICVRSGFHCAQPLHESLQVPPTLRASFSLYNTPAEVNHFVEALKELVARQKTTKHP
jgi:cysteine desulfurase/selenocysteine lyase